ncbi:MAG: rod shape-determining protein MreD [Lachnospiraceae bacterium]|jgi:rod shape-determining protein MreD|nr:rod shape-determining protein MreD [Lachnospiraceae bacterium]
MIRKVLIGTGAILGCFLLQTNLFPAFRLAAVTPNLLIVLVASCGFMRGQTSGMLVGFFSGLLLDAFSGGVLGFNMLLYTSIGYANGYFQRMFFADDIKFPVIMIGISSLISSSLTYIAFYFLNGDFAFWNQLRRVVIPELIYTMLLSIPLYRLILAVHTHLEKTESKRASKFV